VPRQGRTRAVSRTQTRSFLAKAQEFLDAASTELGAGRTVAATSLAIHAAINAADALTGVRTGRRAAGQDHDHVRMLLRECGPDGAEVEKELARLLPMKTKAEYDPDGIGKAAARHAVERAVRCVARAGAVVRRTP